MSSFEKVKNFLGFGLGLRNSTLLDGHDPLADPQLGFNILYYQERKSVGVKVLAARNLPPNFGNLKPKGYLVKVKLFPGKEKFETQVLSSICPCFDEHFMFQAGITHLGQFTGRFVTFTVYAEFECTNNEKAKRVPSSGKRSMKDQIESFVKNSTNEIQLRAKSASNSKTGANRFSLNNRRIIGVITFNLDKGIFTERGKGGARYTPDLWRTIKDFNSGQDLESRESKKGSLEVTMKYSKSEDGKNDMLQISLTKFRCSMATMHEHEKLGGNLYLKMATHEFDVIVSKWKGDTFSPTISMRIEPQTATMITTINNYNLQDRTKVVIKLKARSALQKYELGTIVIDRNTELFQNIVENPTISFTKKLDFQ